MPRDEGLAALVPFFVAMFLTAYNLAHYLTARGLITTESLVDGDFVLAEAGRRNRNFKVARRSSPGIFVKQVKSTEAQAIATLQREAAFYRSVEKEPGYEPLRGLMPRFLDYDAARHAISLVLTGNAESLSEIQLRDNILAEGLAAEVGATLARIHSMAPVVAADPVLRPKLPCQIPWPLNVDQVGYTFLNVYGALGAQLTQTISQSPVLSTALPALRRLWQYDALVHGDMKWDNCLRSGDALVIVDWELADLGDGAWDVASIFKEYIASTVLDRARPDPRGITVEATRPSVRAFWRSYCAGRGLSGAAAQQYLDRAVGYLSARLVVAVLEYCAHTQQLDASAELLLEYSRRILEHPQIAAAQLVGVPAN